MPGLAGSAISWQNNTLPGTTAFAAELPIGQPTISQVARYARAVLAAARLRPESPATPSLRRVRGWSLRITVCPLRAPDATSGVTGRSGTSRFEQGIGGIPGKSGSFDPGVAGIRGYGRGFPAASCGSARMGGCRVENRAGCAWDRRARPTSSGRQRPLGPRIRGTPATRSATASRSGTMAATESLSRPGPARVRAPARSRS